MHRDGTGATRPLSAELPAGRWSALSVSADGKRVAVLSEPRLVVVDARTGHVLGHYEAEGASELSGVTWVESSLLVSRYTFQGDLWLLDRGGSASAGGRAPER
jgi:hypothetical protein